MWYHDGNEWYQQLVRSMASSLTARQAESGDNGGLPFVGVFYIDSVNIQDLLSMDQGIPVLPSSP